ncbi:TPA: hypothetical protein ACH3X1_012249 [Trebouxia sp. C0004]
MPNVVPNTQTSAGQGPGRGARGSATGVIPARSQSTLPERFRRGPATPAADSGNSTSGSEEHEDIGATDPTSQPWFNGKYCQSYLVRSLLQVSTLALNMQIQTCHNTRSLNFSKARFKFGY